MARLPKALKKMVGQEFDKDQLNDQAAICGIRLTRVFATSVEEGDDGKPQMKRRDLTHYYNSFSRFNIELRAGVQKKLMERQSPGSFKQLKRLQKASESLLKRYPNISHDEFMEELSRMTGQGMDVIEKIMADLQKVMDREMEKSGKILERGYLLPWERLKFKETLNVKLPELPQAKYKGCTLKAVVNHGVIQSMELTR